MARRIRYHEQFRRDLAEHVGWLARNRPAEQRENLRREVRAFVTRVSAFPAIGEEVERTGTVSYRVRLLGPLPYLVWYSYDEADANGPVSLLMLLHEAQDRAHFDPRRFE